MYQPLLSNKMHYFFPGIVQVNVVGFFLFIFLFMQYPQLEVCPAYLWMNCVGIRTSGRWCCGCCWCCCFCFGVCGFCCCFGVALADAVTKNVVIFVLLFFFRWHVIVFNLSKFQIANICESMRIFIFDISIFVFIISRQ